MKLADAVLILTCKCDKSSYFASESLDRPLTGSERWAARLHQLACGNCRRVARQLKFLHRLLVSMPLDLRKQLAVRACVLSAATKARMRQRLLQEARDGDVG